VLRTATSHGFGRQRGAATAAVASCFIVASFLHAPVVLAERCVDRYGVKVCLPDSSEEVTKPVTDALQDAIPRSSGPTQFGTGTGSGGSGGGFGGGISAPRIPRTGGPDLGRHVGSGPDPREVARELKKLRRADLRREVDRQNREIAAEMMEIDRLLEKYQRDAYERIRKLENQRRHKVENDAIFEQKMAALEDIYAYTASVNSNWRSDFATHSSALESRISALPSVYGDAFRPGGYANEAMNRALVGVKRTGDNLDEAGVQTRDNAVSYATGRRDTLVNSDTGQWIGAKAAAVRNDITIRELTARVLELFMNVPRTHTVNPTRGGPNDWGRPIYYINGILTPFAVAKEQAEELAIRLRRPVRLLHNRTMLEGYTGSPATDDLAEAAADRMWPVIVKTHIPYPSPNDPIDLVAGSLSVATVDSVLGGLTGGLAGKSLQNAVPFVQLNEATKQLTHVLYHANEPVTIVSHSQGVLITRNAYFAAALLGQESKVRNKTCWIATGLPINDLEIDVRPRCFGELARPDDPVASLIGMRGGGDRNVLSRKALEGSTHDPIINYFPRIRNRQNDPRGNSYQLQVDG